MGQRRTVIEVEGLDHGDNPIPVGVTIGKMLFTGTVPGIDRATGRFPDDKSTEIAKAFENVDAVLQAAGASWSDIAKVDVSLRDKADRAIVNEQWLKRFPNEHDRPVRHTTASALPPQMNIQLEIVAVLA